MFCSIKGATVYGVQGKIIKIETDINDGLPSFDMVGLLSSEVREARERVRSSLKNMGITIPPKRITINLSPASMKKEGTGFDLPIAVSILCSVGIIDNEKVKEYMFAGELGLDGTVKPVYGIISMVDAAVNEGIQKCIVPYDNINEARMINKGEIIGITKLPEIIEIINYGIIQDKQICQCEEPEKDNIPDFSEICGQDSVIRAGLIAACGMHHFLMLGVPGSGKSMIASRIPYILPEPTQNEMIEITKIYSASGKLCKDGLMRKRPYRAPHHTMTSTALIGGGRKPDCGEISLAHNGVLFLDELTEFKRDTIDSLRQPMEDGRIIINRINGSCIFPAEFMLVGAANRCKCGYYPDRNRCNCSESDVKRYLQRISGPLLNRIDICVDIPKVSINDMGQKGKYSNKELKNIVNDVRKIQAERFKKCDILFNSRMNINHVKKYAGLKKEAEQILKEAYEKLGMSARTYYKTIKVARTIADTDDSLYIEEKHILEALGYRLDNLLEQ